MKGNYVQTWLLVGSIFAAWEVSAASLRKAALEKPTQANYYQRKQPEKKYYRQSVTNSYAATSSSTPYSQSTLPQSKPADAGPKFLGFTSEFIYTTNTHGIGNSKNSTEAEIDLYLDFNVNSDFAFLLETGASKNLTAPQGDEAHTSSMNNTYLGAKVRTYKDDIWDTYLRGYYVAPTNLSSREDKTMTGGFKLDATIMPRLYKGDDLKIVYRFRPTYIHYSFDEKLAHAATEDERLPNLADVYEIRNRLSFILWDKFAIKLHYNYYTYENTFGTRVDDKYLIAEEFEYSFTDNFYAGFMHSRKGAFYAKTGVRDSFSLYSETASSYSVWFGVTF